VVSRHARMIGPGRLRRSCQATLIALAAQFGLGMILNLYVQVPASDQHAGFIEEIRTAPFALTVHALLGIALVFSAVILLIRAIDVQDRQVTVLAAVGLAAIIGAFAAGEMFVRNGQNSASLTMAILTAVALAAYVRALGRVGATAYPHRHGALPPELAEEPWPEEQPWPPPEQEQRQWHEPGQLPRRPPAAGWAPQPAMPPRPSRPAAGWAPQPAMPSRPSRPAAGFPPSPGTAGLPPESPPWPVR